MLRATLGELALYFLAVWGMSYVTAKAKVGEPIRIAAALFGKGALDFVRCPVCTGFWFGLLVGWGLHQEVWGSWKALPFAILGGFACAGFNRIVYGFLFAETLPTETEGNENGKGDTAGSE